MTKKVEFQEIEISKLKPAPYNPRIDLQPLDPEYQKLKNSIEEFGFVEPIIYNRTTGFVVGGHQRLKVLTDLGYKKAQCAIVELTEAQEKALNIGLNKIGGDWDFEKLKDLLLEVEKEIDLTLTGFDQEELDQLVRDYFDDESDITEEDDFDAEAEAEAIIEPVSKPGDIWQLGPHRLMVGDATNQAHVLKLMNGSKAKLLFSDPPYNVGYNAQMTEEARSFMNRRKDKLKILNDKMEDVDFLEFLAKAFRNWYTIAEPGAPFYICHSDTEGLNFRNAIVMAGFELKQVLIWVKNTIVMSRQDYHWQHEPILYGWKGGSAHRYFADRTKSTVYDDELDYKALNKLSKKELVDIINDIKNQSKSTVLREAKPSVSKLHPTMKPLKLVRNYIMNSSRRGDIVVDTFLGSGTTLIASEQLGRVCYGLEFDPVYADVIIKRYEQFTGNQAVKIQHEQTNGKQ